MSEHAKNEFPVQDLLLYPEFIDKEEEKSIMSFVDKSVFYCDKSGNNSQNRIRRKREIQYEDGHFDSVIKSYRERLVRQENLTEISARAFERIKSLSNNDLSAGWKNSVHFLDLSSQGQIGWHVDNVEYSGGLVAGLCLNSDCIMKFRKPEANETNETHVLLPRRCLYIQSKRVRYDYEHEIKPQNIDQTTKDRNYVFKYRGHDSFSFPQSRRVSMILRDEKTI